MRRILLTGLLIGFLSPASPQFLEPSAADKAHMEWLRLAWSQTANDEKANFAWFAEIWPRTAPFDKTSAAWPSRMSSEAESAGDKARWDWLAAMWANADEAERAHWDWLASMWARASAAVRPGATRAEVLKVLKPQAHGGTSSSLMEQYVMGRCPFILVTALLDTEAQAFSADGSPDNSARIEKVVRQELWPFVPLKPDAADAQHCQQLREDWWQSTDTERAELARRAKEWSDTDSTKHEALARLAGMTFDEKLLWDWVAQRWNEAKAIRPGISEADLFAIFDHDGGMQVIPPGRWVLRRCSFIKIDVQFERNPEQPRPSDSLFRLPGYTVKTTTISEPRLEPAIWD
jgi:hypothetical protein